MVFTSFPVVFTPRFSFQRYLFGSLKFIFSYLFLVFSKVNNLSIQYVTFVMLCRCSGEKVFEVISYYHYFCLSHFLRWFH